MKQVTLTVYGMKCVGCTNTVKSALEDYPGVKKAKVNLMPPEALVTYNGDFLPFDLIKYLEDKCGYKALVKV